jgi:uroporphyrinogen III methyltransferase/synthase
MPQLLPILRVVHRNSPQFAEQVKALFALFPELSYELVAVRSKVSGNEGINHGGTLFTQKSGVDLHQELALGTADLVVHPAHELPYPVGDGLEVLALIDATALIQSPETSFQNNLVVVSKGGRGDLKAIFSSADLRTGYGQVILVGFGPGNPDLLTLGGDKALTAADIIYHDDLVDKEFLQKYAGEKVYVGKRKDRHSVKQEEINQFLLSAAKSGKNVVRLKGGDPMVFAHGGEEIEFLQRNLVEVDVIPGVSAGIAVSAYTKVPLTHRGIASSVAFISGHSDAFQIPTTDTLVYYMAGSKIRLIARKAIAQGKNPKTPAMLVHNISLPDQQNFFYTLEELADCEKLFPTPLTIVIGKVVSLRHKTEEEALKPTLLVTGTSAEKFHHAGTVIHQPLIEISRISSSPDLEKIMAQPDQFDWIFFTSRYTVQFFFEFLNQYGKDARSLTHLKIASMGTITTQALKNCGIMPDLQPEGESSEGLIAAIEQHKIPAGRVVIPRSNLGLSVLPDNLARLGWEVNRPIVYQNRFPDQLQQLDLSKVDIIVFPAPSCVTNFVRLYGAIPEDKQYIFRGKETRKRFLELTSVNKG